MKLVVRGMTMFILTSLLHASFAAFGQDTGKPSAPDTSKAVPVSMTECEGVNNCATWTFLGNSGNGKWPSGSEANLTVTNSLPDHVVIERSDSTGSTPGYTFTYSGERRGNTIAGWYTSRDSDKKPGLSGAWYAIIETNSAGMPSEMWHCTVNHTTAVWTWNGSYYAASDGDTGKPDPNTKMTVSQFTPQSVVLHRTQPGATADLVGKISAEGNSIEGNGTWHSNGATWSGPFKMFWGTAKPLDCRAPAQQPATVVVRPVVACVPWFFGFVCN